MICLSNCEIRTSYYRSHTLWVAVYLLHKGEYSHNSFTFNILFYIFTCSISHNVQSSYTRSAAYVHELNQAQSTWTATTYRQFEGMEELLGKQASGDLRRQGNYSILCNPTCCSRKENRTRVVKWPRAHFFYLNPSCYVLHRWYTVKIITNSVGNQ